MEGLDVGQLFTDAAELDGLAGHCPNAEGSTATGITIQLGEDDAVHIQLVVECLGHIHCILTGHGVHYQQDFLGLDGFLDALQLVHQCRINMQPTGGIDNQHITAVVPGVFNGFLGGLHRILCALFENRHIHLLADHLQLLDGSRTINVAGGQHGLLALLGQVSGQLGGHGGFTGTLQTTQHVNGRNATGPSQLGVAAAHQLRHFLIDDFNDLLTGGQGGENLLSYTLLGNLFNEILGNSVVDVSFQKSHADFPHTFLHGLLVELALAGHLPQCVLKLFA